MRCYLCPRRPVESCDPNFWGRWSYSRRFRTFGLIVPFFSFYWVDINKKNYTRAKLNYFSSFFHQTLENMHAWWIAWCQRTSRSSFPRGVCLTVVKGSWAKAPPKMRGQLILDSILVVAQGILHLCSSLGIMPWGPLWASALINSQDMTCFRLVDTSPPLDTWSRGYWWGVLGWSFPSCSVFGVRRSTGLQSTGGQWHYSESLGYCTILDGVVAWCRIFLGSDRQPWCGAKAQ